MARDGKVMAGVGARAHGTDPMPRLGPRHLRQKPLARRPRRKVRVGRFGDTRQADQPVFERERTIVAVMNAGDVAQPCAGGKIAAAPIIGDDARGQKGETIAAGPLGNGLADVRYVENGRLDMGQR